jgi:hypothetical protein
MKAEKDSEISELKQQNEMLKSDNEKMKQSLCNLGATEWC